MAVCSLPLQYLFVGTGPIMNWYYHTKIKLISRVLARGKPGDCSGSTPRHSPPGVSLSMNWPPHGSIFIKCLFFCCRLLRALLKCLVLHDYERGIIRRSILPQIFEGRHGRWERDSDVPAISVVGGRCRFKKSLCCVRRFCV